MASYCAICCYYAIGIPLALLIAFKLEFGVIGLEGGITGAVMVQCGCYALLLNKTNW